MKWNKKESINLPFFLKPEKNNPKRKLAFNLFCFVLEVLLITGFVVYSAYAHTPYMACFDNEDGTITCNGEFSDGSSAAGTPIRIENRKGKIIQKGKMDEDGEYTFNTPKGKFIVVFDAGPGHVVKEKSESIVE